ncbi:hypothetical protein QR680_006376 [Steinernema hermaphroditum]|uniref:Uncharacterized protein n=1 Tax=Steinernema hermaphroditum TaxID=289476 RepID=A0AA39HXQ3_9BILA|nr:hypothetical protein QR680_006376 [Steinernema hermaphroditum]
MSTVKPGRPRMIGPQTKRTYQAEECRKRKLEEAATVGIEDVKKMKEDYESRISNMENMFHSFCTQYTQRQLADHKQIELLRREVAILNEKVIRMERVQQRPMAFQAEGHHSLPPQYIPPQPVVQEGHRPVEQTSNKYQTDFQTKTPMQQPYIAGSSQYYQEEVGGYGSMDDREAYHTEIYNEELDRQPQADHSLSFLNVPEQYIPPQPMVVAQPVAYLQSHYAQGGAAPRTDYGKKTTQVSLAYAPQKQPSHQQSAQPVMTPPRNHLTEVQTTYAGMQQPSNSRPSLSNQSRISAHQQGARQLPLQQPQTQFISATQNAPSREAVGHIIYSSSSSYLYENLGVPNGANSANQVPYWNPQSAQNPYLQMNFSGQDYDLPN